MKLWEKTFITTFLLFLLILDCSLFALTVASFRTDLLQARRAAVLEFKSISYATANLYGLDAADSRLLPLYLRYQQSGTRLTLSAEGSVLIDTIGGDVENPGGENPGVENSDLNGEPLNAQGADSASGEAQAPGGETQAPSGEVQVPGGETQAPGGEVQAPGNVQGSGSTLGGVQAGTVRIVRLQGVPHLQILDAVYAGENSLELLYLKDLSPVYLSQQRRLTLVILVSLLLSAAVGGILYAAMRNIYRPIENIAHELRTPLTGIKGYAQYLMMARLSEEDRHFATSQILAESQSLQDIVEKLLIMGNLRKGTVELGPVSFEQLFSQLRLSYPNVSFRCDAGQIQGDETLLRSLLSNLIGNAVRAGGRVTVTAEGRQLRVWNSGAPLPADLLKHLNRNTAPPRQQVRENGLGVRLCHDIVRLHRGTLSYRSGEGTGENGETGTLVVAEFPPDRTGR